MTGLSSSAYAGNHRLQDDCNLSLSSLKLPGELQQAKITFCRLPSAGQEPTRYPSKASFSRRRISALLMKLSMLSLARWASFLTLSILCPLSCCQGFLVVDACEGNWHHQLQCRRRRGKPFFVLGIDCPAPVATAPGSVAMAGSRL